MKKIPPEIDQMIWSVAEQGNPNAETEFLKRYPLYREELLRRKNAVSGLRTSKPVGPVAAKAVPRFVPKDAPNPRPAPRMVLAVSLLSLLALAFASYTVTSMLTPPARVEHPSPPRPVAPTVAEGNANGGQGSGPVTPTPAPPSGNESDTPSNEGAPVEELVPAYEKPQSLIVKKANLIDVLNLIQAETGMKVVIAPGMPNPSIAVEYRQMTAMEMLRDLGQTYQFTPFDQGDGSVVIYPVVNGPAGAEPVRRIGG